MQEFELRRILIGAALFVGLVVLAVEGFYVYRFYADPARFSNATDETASEQTSGLTNEYGSSKSGGSAFDATFVHRATSENIVDNRTYLDNPLTNENPDAFLSVTPRFDSESGPGTYNEHPIGVFYDTNRLSWAIFNQDREAMPDGAAFNVAILREPTEAAGAENTTFGRNAPNKTTARPSELAFIHHALTENISGNRTYLDHPRINNHPKSFLSVTQNWNPRGGPGIYNEHPIAVWYDLGARRWVIFNQDTDTMPDGAAFNVVASE
jgi:hypothetical protein